MFKLRSPSVVCPVCGNRNTAKAKFCAACAARLGEEPSIAHAQPQAAAAATPTPPHDTGMGAPRTNYSRPMPLSAPPSDALGFWFKFCMTGLVVMLGFIAWAVYVLTGSKAVPPLPAGQGTSSVSQGAAPAAPEAPATPAGSAASTPPPPLVAGARASAPQKSVAAASTASSVSAAPATSSVPAATPAMPSQSAARVATTRAPDADVNLPARRSSAEAAQQRPEAAQQRFAGAQQRQASRERSRPPVWNEEEESAAPGTGAWVMPSRPPADTSSPQFRDAGPPIVPGPGPREPYVASQETPMPAIPAGDLGPPVTVGPGPRYDYSTPSAGRR